MAKRAILSICGTVGKTTMTAMLMAPRMPNAEIFAVETVNSTAEVYGLTVRQFGAHQFQQIFKQSLLLDDLIIDVGANCALSFTEGLVKFEDSQLEFSEFIIPVIAGAKEQKETLVTVKMLNELGIPPEKIKIIFNRVSNNVDEEFAAILNFARREKLCIADPRAAIFENELFDMLSAKKMTIIQILADQTDYRELARKASSDGDKRLAGHYADLHAMKGLARSVTRNLDQVWSVLFTEAA